MSSSLAGEGVWYPLDYDHAWAPFNERFDFKPDFPRFAAGEHAINAAALRCFVWLVGEREMTALDWQHTPYRYSPAKHAVAPSFDWLIPVFPNGDYYIHLAPGLTWGSFGHPWQQSLTLWGDELVESLGAELLAWLPLHSHSKL